MGFALGWIVIMGTGMAGATPTDTGAAPIKYTVRMVETQGMGWREGVMAHLKPVTRQGAATVWTMPLHVANKLVQEAQKDPSCQVTQGPQVVALSGVPATIQCRANRDLVTRVSWNGDEIAPAGAPERVRLGWHTTFVGRKLDQGVLVKLVFEDTHIRAIHKVKLNRSSGAACSQTVQPASSGMAVAPGGKKVFLFVAIPPAGKSPFKAADSKNVDARWSAYELDAKNGPFEVPDLKNGCMESDACCESSAKADASVQTVALDVPEIGSQEVAGEWLIPNNELLLLSFGAYTAADKNGKAVVKERLAIIGAEEAMDAAVPPPVAHPTDQIFLFKGAISPPVTATPSAPGANSFGPVPPALRVLPIDPATLPPLPPPPVPPGIGPHAPAGSHMPALRPGLLGPVAAPVAPASRSPLPMPAAPDRTLPQGYHSDGTKADVPRIPEDEMDAHPDSSESSEPLPSPQTKKPQKPKPPTDAGTTKAGLPQQKFSFTFKPGDLFQSPVDGLQFAIPLKSLSFKLPFNQTLDIEIRGRLRTTPAPDSDKPRMNSENVRDDPGNPHETSNESDWLWLFDQPSHMTPYRIHGGAGP